MNRLDCKRAEALDRWEDQYGNAYPGDIYSEVECDCEMCKHIAEQWKQFV